MVEDLAKKVSDGNVIVLRAGDERQEGDWFYAPASIVVIKGVDKRFGPRVAYTMVDAGGYGEQEKVIRLLRQNISPGSPIHVRQILITHGHPDHAGSIGEFTNAEVIMPDSIFYVNKPNHFKLTTEEFRETPGQTGPPCLFDNVSIISTPGHAGWDLSVLYRGERGIIAVVGDLFWSKKDWEHNSEFLELCMNPEKQKRSREYVRERLRPDVVVPGHGPAFAPQY